MLKTISLILFSAFILVFLWFRDGYLLGSQEGALPFYKLERYLEPTAYAWMEHPGLGNVSLLTTAAKPTYIFLTFLQNSLHIPGFIIQAGVFYFILINAGVGIYLLSKTFFPKLPNKFLILAVFFYWFNPISQTSVWNRFLLNYMFFYGMLPITMYIFVKGLKTKKYIYAFLLTIIIGMNSYALSSLVFVLLFWITMLLFFFFFFITAKESATRIFYVKYTASIALLFTLTNSWWISQLLSLHLLLGLSPTISNFSSSVNLSSLESLSNRLGNLTDIFILVNSSFIQSDTLKLFNFYSSFIVILIQFVFTAILLFTIIKNRRELSILILSGIFLMAIFLTKGVSSPLGEIYKIFFQKILFLQVFRNPFEKFSFILALSYAALFPFSIYFISNYFSTKLFRLIINNLIFLFTFGFIVIIFGFPFYSGLVFTKPHPVTGNNPVGFKVKVPDYYTQASDFMKSSGENFRYIGFPLGDEGITYKWEQGYSGVELSSTLFYTPGILFNTAVPYYTKIVPQIEKSLLQSEDFLSIANTFNGKFLLVRSDIDWQERKMTDPSIITARMLDLESKNKIKKVAQFGAITIWENLKWKDFTFYPANEPIKSSFKDIEDLASLNTTDAQVLINSSSNAFNMELSKSSIPSITYQKINPAKYIVSVKNASSPFILVFSELFSSNWKASYDDNTSIYEHLRANFYANSWLIKKEGDFLLNIEFIPQHWYELGQNISLIAHGLNCVFLLCLLLKNAPFMSLIVNKDQGLNTPVRS